MGAAGARRGFGTAVARTCRGRAIVAGLKCEEGGALVEAAFVLPILILLMLGIFQIAFYVMISTSTQSAALVASQTFAGARGGSGTAVTTATAAVNALMCSSTVKLDPAKITVKLYVNNSSGTPTLCATCKGASAPTCSAPPTTNATCDASCDTALTNAAPNPSTSTYVMSSVSVQTACSSISFVSALSSLVCPITSQVYGVVQ
jgi:hypothetical protein